MAFTVLHRSNRALSKYLEKLVEFSRVHDCWILVVGPVHWQNISGGFGRGEPPGALFYQNISLLFW